MSLLPYNPYFDGRVQPYHYHERGASAVAVNTAPGPWGVAPFFQHPLLHSPFGWHGAFSPLAYGPFAMLRAAEEHLWRDHYEALHSPQSQPSIQNGEFNYRCQALGYKPDELGVDIQGNQVVIRGQHRQGAAKNKGARGHPGGHHQFYRRFTLPESVDPESLKCDFDDSGSLVISGRASPTYNAIEYGGGRPKAIEGGRSSGGGSSQGRRTPIPITRDGPREEHYSDHYYQQQQQPQQQQHEYRPRAISY